MEAMWDWIVQAIFHVLDFDKASLKEQFVSAGLGHYWNFLRDYVFNYKVWLMGLLPCLALEWFVPAKSGQKLFSYNLLMDMFYPLFSLVFVIPISVFLSIQIKGFFDAYLGFLNLHLIDNWPTAFKVVTFLVVNDFLFYFSHYLRHRVKWLWYFHVVHHSQEGLNAMTTHRFHFLDNVASNTIKTLPLMIVGGDFPSFWLYLVLNNFWGYFIHSNVQINLGLFSKVFVSPQFHRVHHSAEPEHADMNFGERFIFWDWLFGTMVPDTDVYPDTGVYQVERWVVEHSHSPLELMRAFFAQTWYPFYKILGFQSWRRSPT